MFVVPPKAEVGVLSPEIAGEGTKVILSDGEQVNWNPPPPKPVTPDWSQIKSIRKYFGRTDYQIWPAWLYHPKEQPRLVKNEHEAAQLGVCYRRATLEEKGRYGRDFVWDWKDGCEWRPYPLEQPQFDPANPGMGKVFVPSAPNQATAQHSLIQALIPAVAEAVAKSLKSTGPAAPSNIDPEQWEQFLQFQAFQKTQQLVDEAASAESEPSQLQNETEPEEPKNALSLTVQEEWDLWAAEAKDRGIKVDGRWSLQRLKDEVEKAA